MYVCVCMMVAVVEVVVVCVCVGGGLLACYFPILALGYIEQCRTNYCQALTDQSFHSHACSSSYGSVSTSACRQRTGQSGWFDNYDPRSLSRRNVEDILS
eukprot:m.273600 g.273600  ORF g.273600 m.273600 type:complete len:100 (-) comp107925_c0_seq1:848-1147(-)